MTDNDTLREMEEALSSLYVWPQSIADHYADTLTPRQIEKLYEVGNVAERAAEAITRLQAKVERLEGENARLIAELAARPQWAGGQSPITCGSGSVAARDALGRTE